MAWDRRSGGWTRRGVLATAGGAALGLMAGGSARAGETVVRDDLAGLFAAEGVVGTMAVFEPASERSTLIDAARAATRFTPASTFKIANSLIALETGVVADENEIIPYGGKPQWMKTWEKDMSMREAIALSAVPHYQELARRIGISRYRDWLARLDYGNRDPGAVVDRFWLDGPLAISAIEQARFVARLAAGTLPASPRAQAIVRDILKLESRDGRTLFAKTGWKTGDRPIGWWTGWVDQGGAITAFSLNIDMAKIEAGPKRLFVGRAVLAALRAY
jgi:beta-lactamase class D